MTLNAKIGGFMDFLAAATQSFTRWRHGIGVGGVA